MRTHPQLWPLHRDRNLPELLAQVVSRPRVARPVRAADQALPVNLPRVAEAAMAVDMDMGVAMDMGVDMDTAGGMAAVEVTAAEVTAVEVTAAATVI
jgi:hypothetical protein